MRTEIFSDFPRLGDEFREHLDILWSLSDEQREGLMEGALDSLWVDTKGQRQAIVERTIASVPGDQADLLKSLTVLRFICREWNPVGDTTKDFIADLKDLSLISTEHEAEATAFLEDFLSKLEGGNVRRLKRIYAGSLLPSYASIRTLVDIRPVFDRPFGAGLDDKIEEHSPKYIGWVPVILVHIRRDAGPFRDFDFQCDERDARRIMDFLQAALRDLDEAKKSMQLQEDEK